WSVAKDREMDFVTACEFLRVETESNIVYELFFKLPQGELEKEELVAQAKEEATLTSNGKENVCDDDISVTRVVDKGKWNVDKRKRNVDNGKGKMVDDGNVVMMRSS
ncbi:hypothetical protein Tco_1480311, partial [Tanacetum coccineum]